MTIPGYVHVTFTDGTSAWVSMLTFCRLDPSTVRCVRFDSDNSPVEHPATRPA